MDEMVRLRNQSKLTVYVDSAAPYQWTVSSNRKHEPREFERYRDAERAARILARDLGGGEVFVRTRGGTAVFFDVPGEETHA